MSILQLRILQRERERQRLQAIQANKIMRRRIRDMVDPFALPENQFVGMYRLTKDMTRTLIEALEPHLPLRRSPLAIPNELKVSTIIIVLR